MNIEKEEISQFNKLQKIGVIKSKTKSLSCGCALKLVSRTRGGKNANKLLTWRCSNSKCQKYESAFQDSFFRLFRKSFMLELLIIKYWCIQISIAKTVELLSLHESFIERHFVASIYQRLRNLCSIANKESTIKLGGKGKVVEIDESLVFKVKYNRGSGLKRKQIWIFGMVESSFGMA